MQIQYTTLSQNDKQGIDYVKKDYNKDPAKGLTHGLQKDAIQNSVGASQTKKFKDWKITFELTLINGKDALIFTDEGTTGLLGDVLSQVEIMNRKSENNLKDDDHLSRFRTVFNSGGNDGPGSYGRGKLVFQACSATHTILCDSLRKSDNKYIAFKRTINKLQLQESQVFEAKEAHNFIKEETDGKIKPLETFGTRIIILDLDLAKQKNDLSIKDSFLRAFDEKHRDDECELAFDKMIQETWWELMLKCGVNIVLKHGKHEKKVELSEPLKKIVNVKNNESDWKVYDKYNIPFEFNGDNYIIKQLKFVVSPKGQTLPENFQKITTQRKKMKIGALKRIIPHAQIKKNLTGFIIFDEGLEELMLPPEDMTHYGYDHMKHAILKKIRSEVEVHLNKFQKELGLTTTGEEGNLSRTLNDALKDINEQAKELGLIAASGLGKRKKNFKITINEFSLPRLGELKVEYVDKIGVIKFTLRNLMTRKFNGTVKASLSQENNSYNQSIFLTNCELLGGDQIQFEIPKFEIDKSFHYGTKVLMKIEVENENFSNSRFLWLGLEPKKIDSPQIIKLSSFSIEYPRKDSRRIEIGESLKNLQFSLLNQTPFEIESKISITIKRESSEDRRELQNLLVHRDLFKSLSEIEKEIPEIQISSEVFSFFENEPIKPEKRKCRLEITVLANKDYPELGIIHGQNLMNTKKIDFYIGVDDPGMSIFKEVRFILDDSFSRKSYYEPDSDGYIFIFNSGHPHFKKISSAYAELAEDYIKEEMLRSAYNICVKEEAYAGIFDEDSCLGETFSKNLSQDQLKEDMFKIYENLIGRALHKMYAL